MPPPPFQLCEEPEEPEGGADAVVLVRVKDDVDESVQILDFTSSTFGQQSVELPPNIASVVLEYGSFSVQPTKYADYAGDRLMGQYGTAVLMQGSTPIQEYSLMRFESAVVQVPVSDGFQYRLLLVPSVPCSVTLKDLGDRWKYAKLANTDVLPTIDSSVLL